MAHIHFKHGHFLGLGKFEERTLWKEAGFRWSAVRKAWVTERQDVAQSVKGIPWSPAAMAEIDDRLTVAETSRALSYAATTEYRPPVPPGLHPRTGEPFTPFPFQCAGVEYALQRKDTLIGDQPGLGKTLQAVLLFNACPEIKRVLVICPASLKEHWRREFVLWKTREASVGIAETRHRERFQDGFHKNGNPRFKNVVHPEWWPASDISIINYDVLDRFTKQIKDIAWDLVICDEAHALKTPDSGRTLFVLGGREQKKKNGRWETNWFNAIEANRRLFLSGTPMMNRPVELWPMCQAFDPEGLGKDYIEYGYRYCEGFFDPSRGAKGAYNFTGASNQEELGSRLRAKFMIRRLKVDVMPELPPKFRQIVVLDSPQIRDLVAREDELAQALKLFEDSVKFPNETEVERDHRRAREIIERVGKLGFDAASDPDKPRSRNLDLDYASAVLGLEPSAVAIQFEEMAMVRRELGLAKLTAAIPWIRNYLDGGEKLLVFGYHTDVLKEAYVALNIYNPILIWGGVHPSKRQPLVDVFQGDETCRVALLQIDAAGQGLTLTRAKDACFIEGDWVPTKLEQALDRISRIGKVADKIIGFHLVANGSLDAQIAHRAWDKEGNICAVLDT